MFGRVACVAALMSLALSSAAWADFRSGMKAFKAGDYALAVEEWMPMAEGGHAKAQNNVAYLYSRGFGVPRDAVASKGWYMRAAEQGYPVAQYNLGLIYGKGLGVEKDPAAAFAWFLKAAEQGHARAQYAVALRLANGSGVEKDPASAYMWLALVSDQARGKLKARVDTLKAKVGRAISPADLDDAVSRAAEHKLSSEENTVSSVLASRLVKRTSTE